MLFSSTKHTESSSAAIPASPGTYLLLLSCSITRRMAIGRLGKLLLQPGFYIYVGSAFGPGGLRARIAHHQRLAQKPHWHIDYLRKQTQLLSVRYRAGAHCEHQWAASLLTMPGAVIPLARFGASDCRCLSHLVHFDKMPPNLPCPN